MSIALWPNEALGNKGRILQSMKANLYRSVLIKYPLRSNYWFQLSCPPKPPHEILRQNFRHIARE